MSDFSDRVLMTIIVVTGVAGLVGYWFTIGVTDMPDWFTRTRLIALAGVGLLVLVVAIWEGLSLMD